MGGEQMGGVRVAPSYFSGAILDGRSTLHLTYRLAVRTVQAMSVAGAAGPGSGLWRAALPAFIVLDLVTWQLLRRSPRLGLAWRIPLDCVDIVFWSLSPIPASRAYDNAVLIAIPLSVEAGFSLRSRALALPALVAVLVPTARAIAGEPPNPFTAMWLVLGVALGMGLVAYCRELDRQGEAERSRRRAADARWAFLVGQSEVAMGADSVVDVLEGLVPAIGRPGEDSALHQLADGWKGRLAADVASQASFLQVALLGWESAHNRHPDLSGRVEVHIDDGVGTAILTGRQVAWLHSELERRELRGRVQVSIDPGYRTDRPPGAPLDLDVAATRMHVPLDPSGAVRTVDVGPVVFGLAAAQFLGYLSPGLGDISAMTAGMGILLCGLAAWWSHRRLRRDGLRARPAILVAAVGVALVLTVMSALSVAVPVNADGDTVYLTSGLTLLAVLGGMYAHGLGRRPAAFFVAGLAACTALTLSFAPGPARLSSFAGAVLLAVAPYPACRHISRSLARATDDYVDATGEEDELARREAFDEGRASVVSLVILARDDARAQLRAALGTLDPAVVTLVRTRLEEVDRRLQDLAPAGSSSSTTTS